MARVRSVRLVDNSHGVVREFELAAHAHGLVSIGWIGMSSFADSGSGAPNSLNQVSRRARRCATGNSAHAPAHAGDSGQSEIARQAMPRRRAALPFVSVAACG